MTQAISAVTNAKCKTTNSTYSDLNPLVRKKDESNWQKSDGLPGASKNITETFLPCAKEVTI
jgi:hypothetical protein